MPVDAAGDVLDELVVGAPSAQVVDLSVEVGALLLAGDASVDDSRFRLGRWSGSGLEEVEDVLDGVEVLSAGGVQGAELSLAVPSEQGGAVDSILLGEARRRRVFELFGRRGVRCGRGCKCAERNDQSGSCIMCGRCAIMGRAIELPFTSIPSKLYTRVAIISFLSN